MTVPTALTADALVARHAATLAAAGVPTPGVDARLLVRAVLGGTRDGALAGDDPRLSELDRLVAERSRRIPLQLVLGATWFRHLRLVCRPGVFIPRPETEIVAGVAIAAARDAGPRPVVVEPCTGTGAIALAVATEVAGAQVHAGDVSDDAVALARENLAAVEAGDADVAGLADGAHVTITPSDLLSGFPEDLRGTVDVLVSNPPYLPAGDRPTWEPEVADHDPDAALVGGRDGHEVVDALLALSAEWLRPGGTVVLEIDDRRGPDAIRAAEAAGLTVAAIVPDLTGADRAVRATRREERP
ncbi:MAG: peptide chain release factor N(5)-glutamine methyltransferase [Actinobacteria bacterium]|nr:peptide chain release factor N(5)-glutamine methyltransferase [Actinomycetota bacterium]